MTTNEGTTLAPAGQVWVCLACGKTSPTRYGFDASGQHVADPGWDASCVLNACLLPEKRLTRNEQGRVIEVLATEEDE